MKLKCEHDHPDHPEGPCEGEIKIRGSMTMYHFEGCNNSPEDPNRDFAACDAHYEGYRAYWQERWDEVNADIRQGIADAAVYNRTFLSENDRTFFEEERNRRDRNDDDSY